MVTKPLIIVPCGSPAIRVQIVVAITANIKHIHVALIFSNGFCTNEYLIIIAIITKTSEIAIVIPIDIIDLS